jgi:reverse gyrase
MKTTYRGYVIEVSKERGIGAPTMVYSVYHKDSGFYLYENECENTTYFNMSVREMVDYLKEGVDEDISTVNQMKE